jgi:crossover junction endodeoxyribonuclease RusA
LPRSSGTHRRNPGRTSSLRSEWNLKTDPRKARSRTMRILFPWFPKELSPNARVFWRKKAAVAKTYRAAWFVLAASAKPQLISEPEVPLLVTFYPPDRRPRDLDNCIAGIKSGMDGLADALGINDKRFVPTYRMSDTRMGAVAVEIHVKPKVSV